jgi:excisionase family DNA binding protein
MENKLTIRQAAKLTGYSEAHLRRLAKRGDAFEAEMFGYNWAIDKDSLLAFVEKQKESGGRHGPRGSQG